MEETAGWRSILDRIPLTIVAQPHNVAVVFESRSNPARTDEFPTTFEVAESRTCPEVVKMWYGVDSFDVWHAEDDDMGIERTRIVPRNPTSGNKLAVDGVMAIALPRAPVVPKAGGRREECPRVFDEETLRSEEAKHLVSDPISHGVWGKKGPVVICSVRYRTMIRICLHACEGGEFIDDLQLVGRVGDHRLQEAVRINPVAGAVNHQLPVGAEGKLERFDDNAVTRYIPIGCSRPEPDGLVRTDSSNPLREEDGMFGADGW